MGFFDNVRCNDAQLSHLQTALEQLPDSIPLGNSKYNFEYYAPDPDKVELYGSTEAALNNVLEVTFALGEQGPGLVAVVDVIMAALNEFPNSMLLQKWGPILLNIDASNYEDLPESLAQGPGGHPIDQKLLSLAIWCYKKDDPSKANMFCCMETNTGCTTAWKSKNWVKR
ncbi:hypothetical protein BDR04DRAFT_1117642 [Suillus decipiens]|nr:hypothetical protein BDR04DRAFT_1117642 [Suillus decipiens]